MHMTSTRPWRTFTGFQQIFAHKVCQGSHSVGNWAENVPIQRNVCAEKRRFLFSSQASIDVFSGRKHRSASPLSSTPRRDGAVATGRELELADVSSRSGTAKSPYVLGANTPPHVKSQIRKVHGFGPTSLVAREPDGSCVVGKPVERRQLGTLNPGGGCADTFVPLLCHQAWFTSSASPPRLRPCDLRGSSADGFAISTVTSTPFSVAYTLWRRMQRPPDGGEAYQAGSDDDDGGSGDGCSGRNCSFQG